MAYLITRCRLLACCLLFAALGASADGPRCVLLIHSFGRNFEPFSTVAEGFRKDLAQQFGQPLEFHDVALESARSDQPIDEAPFMAYLSALFSHHKPDLVVPVGGPAVRFALAHRGDLFPTTPMIVTAVDARHFATYQFSELDAHAPVALDPARVVRDILHVLPATTNLAVVLGNSPVERFWVKTLNEEFAVFTNRLHVDMWNGLTFVEMMKRASIMPPNSAIFFGQMSIDAAGVPHESNDALGDLRSVTKAPIFGLFDFQLSRGIVGGALVSTRGLSRNAAAAAVRILHGESPSRFREPPLGPDQPVYAWNELHAWGIDESRLPPGSAVVNRPQSIWQTHRWQVVTVLSVLLLQGIIVFALGVQMARRRRAEKSLREFGGRLIQAQEAERGRLARELHDDLTQRLARLAIDAGIVERDAADTHVGASVRSVREELVRLSEDVHDLSYRLHPSLLNDLGLADALRAECERVGRSGAHNVECHVKDIPDDVPVDVDLCLFRVAQEALRNIERHARATWIDVTLRGVDGGIQLAVRDNGTGFDPAPNSHRHSLGLASMRERLNLLHGELDIDSTPGHGTTIVAWVPLGK